MSQTTTKHIKMTNIKKLIRVYNRHLNKHRLNKAFNEVKRPDVVNIAPVNIAFNIRGVSEKKIQTFKRRFENLKVGRCFSADTKSIYAVKKIHKTFYPEITIKVVSIGETYRIFRIK
jgi:uncharacterized Fe-S center protein